MATSHPKGAKRGLVAPGQHEDRDSHPPASRMLLWGLGLYV